ncbi:ATP-binding cassette domain-containing protein [Streptomyces indicus]|uniref:ATP-binding cassette domain-containing protein n=1 Tax=Streptomyces indicus TaxID=417292 RepID=UPI001FECB1A7|nr:ATP-binding cassette domain-containing protein [Streptomyces indicus]
MRAVDELSFNVEAGSVTGFLGPNGAGKTTTLRMVLGLVTPDAGQATIGGLPYAALPAPGRVVGAALEATGFHPARSGRDHLKVLCTVSGFAQRRADDVLEIVGLTDAGRRRVDGYSLGMRQRLALAAAPRTSSPPGPAASHSPPTDSRSPSWARSGRCDGTSPEPRTGRRNATQGLLLWNANGRSNSRGGRAATGRDPATALVGHLHERPELVGCSNTAPDTAATPCTSPAKDSPCRPPTSAPPTWTNCAIKPRPWG